MKYSTAYYKMMILGVVFTILAISFMIERQNATLSAVCTVFAFIFLWAPQMLPDHEKYSDEYRGKGKGSN